MFLPAYSSSLAPIELIFRSLKMILKREFKQNHNTHIEGRNECNKILIKEGFIGEGNLLL